MTAQGGLPGCFQEDARNFNDEILSTVLQLDDAEVSFGAVRALRGVSLTVEKGEQVCVIGPSGSGKSTLLGLMNGRRLTQRGSVKVFGESVEELTAKRLRELRRKLAWVPQDLGLVPNLRVLQNVLCGRAGRVSFWGLLRRLAMTKMTEAEEVRGLLERLGIPEKLYERTDTLSGGQQQRVAIARALYQEPAAILADEPVASVDPGRARSLLQLLTTVAKEEGITLVMSLHHVELAKEFFPRLIGLQEGRVVFDQSAAQTSAEELRELYAVGEE